MTKTAGKEMFALAERLFPICRSLTGEGVRETLRTLQEFIPLTVHEVESGQPCLDWTVPKEWSIREAWIKDASGNRIVDFADNNLHVVGYSTPIRAKMSLSELKSHLYSLPSMPTAIPYVTSYYSSRWGFCLSHEQLAALQEGTYEVYIDSSLEDGHLTYADLVIPGDTSEEILISTYVCHPSMANNELSGPVVATYLAKSILQESKRRYTYRFVFIPETIGAIVYLSRHLQHLKDHVVAGYVVTCCGDPGPYSYLQSRTEQTLVDRVSNHILRHLNAPYQVYSFLERGSDERQYGAPGVDLPVGSIMRAKYGTYPEYHTSLDNLDFITADGLEGTLDLYRKCLSALEANHTYRVTVMGEPQLGRRGLYPTLSTKDSGLMVRDMMNLIAYADGSNDLIAIADKAQVSVLKLIPIAETLVHNGLLEIASQ